jgi:hypothetical protein
MKERACERKRLRKTNLVREKECEKDLVKERQQESKSVIK